MSNGALKTGEGQYVDAYLRKQFATELFEEQDYVDHSNFPASCNVPEASIAEINRAIGRVLEQVQDASFVSQITLKAVPGHGDHLPDFGGCSSPIHPNGSTLSPQRLAATLYNASGDAVRDVIRALGDPEVTDKAAEIESGDEDKVESSQGLHFAGIHDGRGVFKNIELLSNEARELVELYGDGVVDVIRDLVRLVAESILNRADLSYESLYCDVVQLTADIASGKINGGVEYSTLNPKDFIERVQRAF